MKKILLLTVVILNCSLLFAQVIEKDKRIFGGTVNLGFNHNQSDTVGSSEPSTKNSGEYINLSPSFGKAIKNNMVFGYMISLNYSHNKAEDFSSNQRQDANSYGAGAGLFFERYFPLTKSISFSAVLPLQVYYNSAESKYFQNGTLSNTRKDKSYGAVVSLYPALNYSLNKRFLLQLTLNNFVSLGYMHSRNETEAPNTPAVKQEGASFGFNTRVNEQTRISDLGFAFRYIF